MPFRFRNLKTKEWWKLFGPFLGIFVAGGATRHFYPPQWWSSTTFYALADALMIAGIIGSLLEMFSAKFMIERVSEDLAQRLVGKGLPRELRAHIQSITKTRLVRSNYVKKYRLSLSDAHDKMVVQMETSFEVRNYFDLPQNYAPINMEETFYSPQFEYVEYALKGDAPIVYVGQALVAKTSIVSDGQVKQVNDLAAISIPPFTESDNRFVRVLLRHKISMPLEYTETTYFPGAATDVLLVLEDIPAGFQFTAAMDVETIHAEGSTTWQFNRSFVEGQNVRVRWFKKIHNSN
jgi:hypothetical protein